MNYKLVIIIVVKILCGDCVEFAWGPCILQYLEPCSENVIQYYLFSSDRPTSAPYLLDSKHPTIPHWINLNSSYKNKLIVHGYGGHLDFYATKAIRDGELNTNQCVYFIFFALNFII